MMTMITVGRVRPLRIPAGARWTVAALCALLAACGDGGGNNGGGTGPVVEPVAAVTLTGAPASPVLAGSTVQLTATPVNAAGAPLQNRTVAWASSDTTIATVSSAGAVSIVGAGPVTITATSEGKEGSAALDARAGGQLGAAGGTLSVLGGRISLTVPPAGLSGTGTFLFRPRTDVPGDARIVPGTVVEMTGTAVFSFSPSAALTLAYDPARLPPGVPETSLQLYQLTFTPGIGNYWSLIRGSRVDAAARTVTGFIIGDGTFAVIGTAAKTVTLDGELLGGALYVGQTRRLSAAAVDVNDDTLTTRVITWSTSDPARATVDAAGRVTGVSTGPVTLTATLDEKQASTTVTVLPRPVAAWSQTAEWSTWRGNTRHDGHVSATLDPSAFRERWTRQISGVRDMNSMATGAGKVFVSSHGQVLGSDRVHALNATDGGQAWSRPTGTTMGVSGPAFAGGRVYVSTYSAADSSRLWSLDAADGGVHFARSFWDGLVSAAPLVDGDAVYTGSLSGALYRLNAATGEPVWRVTFSPTAGYVPTVDAGRVLAFGPLTSSGPLRLIVRRASDGGDAGGTDLTSYPVVPPVVGGAGNVIMTTASALASIPLQGGAPSWNRTGFFPFMAVVGGGVVYAVDNRVLGAYRESDGTRLWTWSPLRGAEPWGPMVLTDNLLFASTGFAASPNSTYAVDLATGKQVWHHPVGGFLALSADGVLYIAGRDGKITAISVK